MLYSINKINKSTKNHYVLSSMVFAEWDKAYIKHHDNGFMICHAASPNSECRKVIHTKCNTSKLVYRGFKNMDIVAVEKIDDDNVFVRPASNAEILAFYHKIRNMSDVPGRYQQDHNKIYLGKDITLPDRVIIYTDIANTKCLRIVPAGHINMPYKVSDRDLKMFAYTYNVVSGHYVNMPVAFARACGLKDGMILPVYREGKDVIIEGPPAVCDMCGRKMSSRDKRIKTYNIIMEDEIL